MRVKNIKMRLVSTINFYMLKVFQSKNVSLGKNIKARRRFNPNIYGGHLTIGDNTFFNNDCSINCHGRITIGDNCLFGENVKIYDHNHIFKDLETPISKQGYKVGEIAIGNNCWIGANTTILANVKIGDNVVIGANCLIYKSIPSNTVVKNKVDLIIQQRNE